MEILPHEEDAENILYLILCDLNEKLLERKLPGFESAFSEPHHPIAQEVKPVIKGDKVCLDTIDETLCSKNS